MIISRTTLPSFMLQIFSFSQYFSHLSFQFWLHVSCYNFISPRRDNFHFRSSGKTESGQSLNWSLTESMNIPLSSCPRLSVCLVGCGSLLPKYDMLTQEPRSTLLFSCAVGSHWGYTLKESLSLRVTNPIGQEISSWGQAVVQDVSYLPSTIFVYMLYFCSSCSWRCFPIGWDEDPGGSVQGESLVRPWLWVLEGSAQASPSGSSRYHLKSPH